MIVWSRVLALVLTLAACSSAGGSFEEGSLPTALDRTLAAESFHIRLRMVYGDVDAEGEGDYIAPDRLSLTLLDGDVRTTSIIIGHRHYDSVPDDPNRFTIWTDPCEPSLELMLPMLAAIREADVGSHLGDNFVFTIDGGTRIVGEARVADGRLGALEVSYVIPGTGDQVREQYWFSDFGKPATVTAPPSATPIDAIDDPLVRVSSGPPACPTGP